jgi:alpha-L-rhamnosidase
MLDALYMAEMAEATGRDSAPFKELAENIKREFRKTYIKDGKFSVMHQTALACAIKGGFLTDQEKAKATEDLKNLLKESGYAFILGCHGLVMIFDALSENGGTQELFNTVVNDKPFGYARSIKEGLTTLPEHFSMYASLNHHFRSPVNAWFYKHLAGISLNGIGFENVVIAPEFVNGINQLKAEAFGIKVSYDNEVFCVDSPYSFTLRLNGKEEKYIKGRYSFKRI